MRRPVATVKFFDAKKAVCFASRAAASMITLRIPC